VATAVQNNPSSQAQAMEKGALAQILLLLQNETEDRVLSKAVPALSGLIRDHPKAVEAFLKANGLRLLAYLLTSTKGDQLSAATKMKVVFLFAYLCRVVPLVRHAVREYSLIKPLADMVARSDSADLREKALACLLEATKDTGLNVEACRELGLPEVSLSRACVVSCRAGWVRRRRAHALHSSTDAQGPDSEYQGRRRQADRARPVPRPERAAFQPGPANGQVKCGENTTIILNHPPPKQTQRVVDSHDSQTNLYSLDSVPDTAHRQLAHAPPHDTHTSPRACQ
jgi:hypothetical protein